jgi:hypothetical protein
MELAIVPKLLVDTVSDYIPVCAKILERIGIVPEKKDMYFVMVTSQHIKPSGRCCHIRVA